MSTTTAAGTTDGGSAVSGTARNDVWVAQGFSVLHFDGAGWTSEKVAHSALLGIWARAPGDVFAWSDTEILHRVGGAWQHLRDNTSGIYDEKLQRRSLAGTASGDIWVARYDGLVERWDGAAWTTDDKLGNGMNVLHASTRDLWVGSNASAGIMKRPRPAGHWRSPGGVLVCPPAAASPEPVRSAATG